MVKKSVTPINIGISDKDRKKIADGLSTRHRTNRLPIC